MQFHDEGSKFEDECDSAFDPTEFAVIKEVFGAKHTINPSDDGRTEEAT